MSVEIQRLDDVEELLPLVALEEAEGFGMVSRLVQDWRTGVNRFKVGGEVLLGARLRTVASSASVGLTGTRSHLRAELGACADSLSFQRGGGEGLPQRSCRPSWTGQRRGSTFSTCAPTIRVQLPSIVP